MKFFAHVGFQKTGSTFLQDILFSCHTQIQYIGSVNKNYESEDLRNLHRFLSEGKGIEANAGSISDCFARVTYGFDHSLPVVLSNEGLTVDYSMYDINRHASPEGERNDVRPMAVRLSRLYDNSRIIFVIREQRSSIESYYFGYATICISGSEDYPNSPLAFEEWYWKEREYFKVNRNYYEIIRIYSDIFGLENIKVFLYENLKNSPQEYIRDICDYVGVDAETGIRIASNKKRRVRLTRREFALRKFLAKTFPSWQRWKVLQFVGRQLAPLLNAGKKPSVSFTPSIMEDVRLNYGDSNKALNETFDLHMEKYDYIISQS